MKLPLFLLTSLAAAGVLALPAGAQTLSNGDYAQCRVYDANGNYEGLSSECLERKRARIRHYQHIDPAPAPVLRPGERFRPIRLPQRCPLWSNRGFGYTSTMITGPYGNSFSHFGTFDNPVNGRPCIAQAYITRGWP